MKSISNDGSFRGEWRALLGDRRTSGELFVTLLCFAVTVRQLSGFLEYIEQRPGVLITDPLLALFPAADVSWYTFALIYSALVAALVHLFRQPRLLIMGMQSYIALALFRMGAMYVLPLEPPTTMIALGDPFVQFFVGTGEVLTKDLFFSGHTSTMFLLALMSTYRPLRVLLLIATALVAACVLIQHVHYTVDVLAAPFFAYGAYRAVALARLATGISHTTQGSSDGMDR